MPEPAPSSAPARAVVERFVACAVAGAWDDALELLATDVEYTNVSLPTIRGRRRVSTVLKALLAYDAVDLEIYVHAYGVDGDVVLTERTDALTIGRLRVQFWVYGRFDVVDGQITVWRDSFDWGAVVVATLRGLVGTVLPFVRARPPA